MSRLILTTKSELAGLSSYLSVSATVKLKTLDFQSDSEQSPELA
jgi:hypothetical protein